MRISGIIAGAALSIAGSAVSGQTPAAKPQAPTPTALPATYQLICQSQISNGLDWSKNEWTAVRFRQQTHLIQIGGQNDCLVPIASALRPLGNGFATRKVCGNIRDLGGKYFNNLSTECTELYVWKSGEWQVTLTCSGSQPSFRASVNGWYHMASIHSDFEDPSPYKDSMWVEAGKCSLVGG